LRRPQQSAALAAALALGASNREVAAELFLAPNTVEFHLRLVCMRPRCVRPSACAGCAAEGSGPELTGRQENGLFNSNQLLLLFHVKVMKITTKA